MRSYTLPQPFFRAATVRIRSAPHDTAWIQGRVMKLLGWIAIILVACVLAWLVSSAETIWSRVLISLLLAGFGVLTGLRIGTQSTTTYIADLQRVNKVLCEQQRELEEVNSILLKQVNAESASFSPAEPLSSSERIR